METFENIRKENRLLFEYVRGSHLYGLNNEDSDLDTGGLFICNPSDLTGLGLNYSPQVADSRNDTTWYELGKYFQMLLKSNATVLETLFIPEDKMILRPSPLLDELFANKEKFITKQCFKPFVAYSIEQIRKARGLNKKIVNPVTKRLKPMDFCYTFKDQGSTKMEYWLEYRGMKQEYCGLVKIPNMEGIYGVYYDWGQHFQKEGIEGKDFEGCYIRRLNTKDIITRLKEAQANNNQAGIEIETRLLKRSYMEIMAQFIMKYINATVWKDFWYWFYDNQTPKGYHGIVRENSNEMVLSPVAKGEKPICYMSFNSNGYSAHCADYKHYKDWEEKRNEKRYKSNLTKNYDSKNMMHSFRLIQMGLEIASGEGVNLDRNKMGDRELLMNIRNHKYEYDELMDMIDKKKEEMDEAMKNSTLPETIDVQMVEDILQNIRKKQLIV